MRCESFEIRHIRYFLHLSTTHFLNIEILKACIWFKIKVLAKKHFGWKKNRRLKISRIQVIWKAVAENTGYFTLRVWSVCTKDWNSDNSHLQPAIRCHFCFLKNTNLNNCWTFGILNIHDLSLNITLLKSQYWNLSLMSSSTPFCVLHFCFTITGSDDNFSYRTDWAWWR